MSYFIDRSLFIDAIQTGFWYALCTYPSIPKPPTAMLLSPRFTLDWHADDFVLAKLHYSNHFWLVLVSLAFLPLFLLLAPDFKTIIWFLFYGYYNITYATWRVYLALRLVYNCVECFSVGIQQSNNIFRWAYSIRPNVFFHPNHLVPIRLLIRHMTIAKWLFLSSSQF